MNTSFRGVIFDMDGTITKPVLDFGVIRQETGILKGDLIDEIDRLDPAERAKAWAVVERHETAALEQVELQDGAADLLARCRRAGLKTGLLTRNLRKSADSICRRFGLEFDAVVTREQRPVKPHPDAVVRMLEQWRLPGAAVLVVGDYIHDIECGRTAGCRTCFFQNPGKPFLGEGADHVVSSMAVLAGIILGQDAQPETTRRP